MDAQLEQGALDYHRLPTPRERMKIPVFHDDQHGTAIIVAAAILNGLEVIGKRLDQVRLVCSRAGAAALACLDHLIALGLRPECALVADIAGVVYRGRAELTGIAAQRRK